MILLCPSCTRSEEGRSGCQWTEAAVDEVVCVWERGDWCSMWTRCTRFKVKAAAVKLHSFKYQALFLWLHRILILLCFILTESWWFDMCVVTYGADDAQQCCDEFNLKNAKQNCSSCDLDIALCHSETSSTLRWVVEPSHEESLCFLLRDTTNAFLWNQVWSLFNTNLYSSFTCSHKIFDPSTCMLYKLLFANGD